MPRQLKGNELGAARAFTDRQDSSTDHKNPQIPPLCTGQAEAPGKALMSHSLHPTGLWVSSLTQTNPVRMNCAPTTLDPRPERTPESQSPGRYLSRIVLDKG